MDEPITWGQIILCDIAVLVLSGIIYVIVKWVKEYKE